MNLCIIIIEYQAAWPLKCKVRDISKALILLVSISVCNYGGHLHYDTTFIRFEG